MDLSLADLAGALWHGASISNSVLTFARLMGADLTEANLGHSDLRGAELIPTAVPNNRTLATGCPRGQCTGVAHNQRWPGLAGRGGEGCQGASDLSSWPRGWAGPNQATETQSHSEIGVG